MSPRSMSDTKLSSRHPLYDVKERETAPMHNNDRRDMKYENSVAMPSGLNRLRKMRSDNSFRSLMSGDSELTQKHRNYERYALPPVFENDEKKVVRDKYVPPPKRIPRRRPKTRRRPRRISCISGSTQTVLRTEIPPSPIFSPILHPISNQEQNDSGEQFGGEKDESRHARNHPSRKSSNKKYPVSDVGHEEQRQFCENCDDCDQPSPWLSNFTDTLCFKNNAVLPTSNYKPTTHKLTDSRPAIVNDDAYLLQDVKRECSQEKRKISRNKDISQNVGAYFEDNHNPKTPTSHELDSNEKNENDDIYENILSDLKKTEGLSHFLTRQNKRNGEVEERKPGITEVKSIMDESLCNSSESDDTPVTCPANHIDPDDFMTAVEPPENADCISCVSELFSRETLNEQLIESQQEHPIETDLCENQSLIKISGPTVGTFKHHIKSIDQIDPNSPISPLMAEFVDTYSTFRMDEMYIKDVMHEMKCSVPFFHTIVDSTNLDSTSTKQNKEKKKSIHSICSEPVASFFKVRGKSYLSDSQKIPSNESMFALTGVDFFKCKGKGEDNKNMSKKEFSFLNRLRTLCEKKNVSVPFLFVINFVTPFGNLLAYFYRPDSGGLALDPDRVNDPAENLWKQFLDGDENYRNNRLKFIPNVKAGPWMIKKIVGSKPALIGQKIPTTYYGSIEENYIEVCLDVTKGGSLANSICSTCAGKSDIISVDLCFLVEAQESEELPEQILASLRLHHIKVKSCPTFEEWSQSL